MLKILENSIWDISDTVDLVPTSFRQTLLTGQESDSSMRNANIQYER